MWPLDVDYKVVTLDGGVKICIYVQIHCNNQADSNRTPDRWLLDFLGSRKQLGRAHTTHTSAYCASVKNADGIIPKANISPLPKSVLFPITKPVIM
jgi:hypothetical protein